MTWVSPRLASVTISLWLIPLPSRPRTLALLNMSARECLTGTSHNSFHCNLIQDLFLQYITSIAWQFEVELNVYDNSR